MKGFEGPWTAVLTTLFLCSFLLGLATSGHCQISAADTFAPAANAFDHLFTPRMELPPAQRRYAEWASDLTVAASLAADTYWSWKQPNRKAAFLCQGLRDGLIVLVTEIVKRLVHRTR